MGIEYKLKFSAPDAKTVAMLLRRVPSAKEMSTPDHRFELGTKASDRDIPDATVIVEPDGAYFCDHGRAGRELLGILVARLVSEFGEVTVTEL